MGIAPAKTIFAHHGEIGQAPIVRKPKIDDTAEFMYIASTNARALVEQANRERGKKEGFRAYSMHDMRGLARIIDEYMQPSRGLDDPIESIGEKTIVFDACLAASERLVQDVDADTGQTVELPTNASVISRLADDLVDSDVQSKVVIYGANNSIRTRPTEKGFDFTERVPGMVMARRRLDATRIVVHGGAVTRSQVAEVPLRNFVKPIV